MKFYPRKCENCGCGMDEGYLMDDIVTLCSSDCLTEYLHRIDTLYFTEWDELDTHDTVFDEDGNEFSIKKKEKEDGNK